MPPYWKAGTSTKSNFSNGNGTPVYSLEPRQGRGVQVEEGVRVALHPPAVGLAVVHRHPPPAAIGFLHLEAARGEGEQVAADRVGLGEGEQRPIPALLPRGQRTVGHRPPSRRRVEPQPEARLQVRLIEERQGGARPVRHEERVEEVVLPVERPVPGRELDAHHVVPGRDRLRRHDDVLVADVEVDRLAGHPHGVDVAGWLREVEDQRPGLGERERGADGAGDRLAALGGNREPDVVVDVEDRGRAPLGQRPRNAGTHRGGGRAAAPGHAGQDGAEARPRRRFRDVSCRAHHTP